MFRKLYWITEQSDPHGVLRATGVYTSIHDLAERGLRWIEPAGTGFRISLAKVDGRGDVLGAWIGPKFEGLENDLQAYVETHEISVEECLALRQSLDAFVSTAAK